MVCAGIGGGLLVRVHGLQPTHRPPRVSDSAESDTPATCDVANPITPEPRQQQSQPPHPTLPHQPYRQPSPCVPHPHSPTRPAPPRPADAHTSPMTKSSNVTPNMSQSISSLSQTSRSTPPSCGCIAIRNQILRRNRQLRDAKLASRVFYDNRKTLEIPTIPRVSNGADDGSRNRLLRRHHQRIDVPKTVRLLMNRIKDEHPELQKTGKGAGRCGISPTRTKADA